MLCLLLPSTGQAAFLLNYGLNYSAETDSTSNASYQQSKVFHKAFIGASVNGAKTLFFGWNINSWNTNLKFDSGNRDTYSLLEMGPRLIWYTNENYNLYVSAEWNPYTRGNRDKEGSNRKIQAGNSLGLGIGYRFRLNKVLGFGAGIHYHTLNLTEEKVGTTTNNLNDKFSNLMPMLELSLVTR